MPLLALNGSMFYLYFWYTRTIVFEVTLKFMWIYLYYNSFELDYMYCYGSDYLWGILTNKLTLLLNI